MVFLSYQIRLKLIYATVRSSFQRFYRAGQSAEWSPEPPSSTSDSFTLDTAYFTNIEFDVQHKDYLLDAAAPTGTSTLFNNVKNIYETSADYATATGRLNDLGVTYVSDESFFSAFTDPITVASSISTVYPTNSVHVIENIDVCCVDNWWECCGGSLAGIEETDTVVDDIAIEQGQSLETYDAVNNLLTWTVFTSTTLTIYQGKVNADGGRRRRRLNDDIPDIVQSDSVQSLLQFRYEFECIGCDFQVSDSGFVSIGIGEWKGSAASNSDDFVYVSDCFYGDDDHVHKEPYYLKLVSLKPQEAFLMVYDSEDVPCWASDLVDNTPGANYFDFYYAFDRLDFIEDDICPAEFDDGSDNGDDDDGDDDKKSKGMRWDFSMGCMLSVLCMHLL